MSTWPTFYLILWWIAAVAIAVAAALVAIPFLIRANRQIDRAMTELFADRDEQQSASNVRALNKWELARRLERKSR